MTVRTNRDLYLFVAELVRRHGGDTRSLDEYLRALWQLAAADRDHDEIPLPRFAGWLDAAYVDPAPPFDPAWSARPSPDDGRDHGYARWEAQLLAQIVDLREMAADGTLEDEMRYFGVDAPRGARWYNFDPRGFLECGLAGSFGGWCEGDDTGRELVPGMTAADVADPATELPAVSWDDLARFLWAGQCYE